MFILFHIRKSFEEELERQFTHGGTRVIETRKCPGSILGSALLPIFCLLSRLIKVQEGAHMYFRSRDSENIVHNGNRDNQDDSACNMDLARQTRLRRPPRLNQPPRQLRHRYWNTVRNTTWHPWESSGSSALPMNPRPPHPCRN